MPRSLAGSSFAVTSRDSRRVHRPGVAVLGCGWLGLPLAQALVADGFRVSGSTTDTRKLPNIQAIGAQAFRVQLGPNFDPFLGADDLHSLLTGQETLVLNVPPRAAPRGSYPQLLRPVADALPRSTVRQVIFISSTGVYPNEPRLMTEADAPASPDAASELLRAEHLFQDGPWDCTVLRLGGLFGPQRPPGRFLANRVEVAQPEAPVNLLHLDDAVGVIQAIIDQRAWGHTFNVCAAEHPTRREFYTAAAEYLDVTPPQFRADDASKGKIISSESLRQNLIYLFQHDNPLAALSAC